jgi:hypothetical protein
MEQTITDEAKVAESSSTIVPATLLLLPVGPPVWLLEVLPFELTGEVKSTSTYFQRPSSFFL